MLRVGKYHIFANVKNIRHITIFFDIFDIFQKMKISNKLQAYNSGCNTLMQYLITTSYQSFVPFKT